MAATLSTNPTKPALALRDDGQHCPRPRHGLRKVMLPDHKEA